MVDSSDHLVDSDKDNIQDTHCRSEVAERASEIYTKRFSDRVEKIREITWEVLCEEFFQSYVSFDDIVVDIGAGDGHFIKNIRAARRIAVDISEHVNTLENSGVEVVVGSALKLAKLVPTKVDVIFLSNFLEHLPNKNLVLDLLDQCRESLKLDGSLLILQPNIRYVGPAYWDYIDHHIALTEHSVVEALDVTGFEVTSLVPRFLPYTSKSRLASIAKPDQYRWFVRLYLRARILWRVFGQQTFIVARAKSE